MINKQWKDIFSAGLAQNRGMRSHPFFAALTQRLLLFFIVGSLAACTSSRKQDVTFVDKDTPIGTAHLPSGMVADTHPLPAPARRAKSHWQPVRWASLPGLADDDVQQAWQAWLQSCQNPPAAFVKLCPEIRRLQGAQPAQIWHWLQTRMQPYRVQAHDGQAKGMLTAYYEPYLTARRQPDAQFRYPLYSAPSELLGNAKTRWFTRQQIETLPQAQAALRGRELAWLSDPVEALILHIQGSGRLLMTEADGRQRQVRMAFAATNNQAYGSVGRWLLDRGLVRDATWPGISAWVQANPYRVQEMLWSNPRYVFFKEEPLEGTAAQFGPRGAQGVPLTAGRSIAVDRASIPYGTPVWLHSTGPTQQLSRMVVAQDTGSAIVGAVRADYFMGWGAEAGDIAGRTKQDLYLWTLWPKGVTVPQ